MIRSGRRRRLGLVAHKSRSRAPADPPSPAESTPSSTGQRSHRPMPATRPRSPPPSTAAVASRRFGYAHHSGRLGRAGYRCIRTRERPTPRALLLRGGSRAPRARARRRPERASGGEPARRCRKRASGIVQTVGPVFFRRRPRDGFHDGRAGQARRVRADEGRDPRRLLRHAADARLLRQAGGPRGHGVERPRRGRRRARASGSHDAEALVLIRERTRDPRAAARAAAEAPADQPAQRLSRTSTSTPAPGSASSCRRTCTRARRRTRPPS